MIDARGLLASKALRLLALVTPALLAVPGAHAFEVCPVHSCRILDTRLGSGDAFGGAPHRFEKGETMSIDATEGFIGGQGGETSCGVPFPEAVGVFINVQVTGAKAKRRHPNALKVYAYNGLEPVGATLSYAKKIDLANGVFVPLCTFDSPSGSGCGDDLAITNGPDGKTDLVIDVTAYAAASCL